MGEVCPDIIYMVYIVFVVYLCSLVYSCKNRLTRMQMWCDCEFACPYVRDSTKRNADYRSYGCYSVPDT